MKTIEVEAYVDCDDCPYFTFISEKIGFVWDEDTKKILLNAYPNSQIEEINDMFKEAISDIDFSGNLNNNNKISIGITPEDGKYKYFFNLYCMVILPELPDYQFKFSVMMEVLLNEERLLRNFDDYISFITFMGNCSRQYTGE
ncbi:MULTISPECIES: hypothetical protein [unclassified Granulicatella]|uniref:hypothetical protein n=1 Tax=unclassified Granulicatella TaxID=2630493 RepID=UPI0010740A26|nr:MULTISPECIES: hypothetical protein [unclassified Granulicatella]MBF0781094.1 hypothetical protein [Granulicatella sp. 19428wC4_WM01]TFU92139.1 hypothetical protein E4T68_08275 [Granulicatella sp. WM01]